MDELTPRLKNILEAVIDSFVDTGRPVGSRYLCEKGDFGLAPSTLRNELARLEQLGYLDHPHTSAGRVPTDLGYRFYVENTAAKRRQPEVTPQGNEFPGGELENALKHAAGSLARITGMLALVSAPSRSNSAIKHIEVLQLHPELVMVVAITASGGVAKKLFVFDEAVDPGLVDWARGFLNDAFCGLEPGSRLLVLRLEEAGLAGAENSFIEAIFPTFDASPADEATGLYVEGVSRFVSRLEEDGNSHVHNLMELLDRQDDIIDLLHGALSASNVYLRIGREMPRAAMHHCSLVAASYGVAHRNLGTVGVLGPMRMDYPEVIFNVRRMAWSLSRLVEEIYQ